MSTFLLEENGKMHKSNFEAVRSRFELSSLILMVISKVRKRDNSMEYQLPKCCNLTFSHYPYAIHTGSKSYSYLDQG